MQHQQQQSMSPARVVFYSGAAVQSPMSPVVAHLYTLIKTLSEAPQDDVKYRALKEISERLEDLVGTPAYASLVDSLIRVFIKLLQETSPQFITENNTLQLRKLMLDLLLRLSANEMMKNYVKVLQQILLRLIYMENEENALIIIKILTDHIKTFRPPFTPDLNTFFAQSKSAFNGMFAHAANEAMFLKRPFITTNKTIEESVAEALKTCYSSATLSYSQQHQAENYTLVPRASQSVKVLAEMSAFLFVLIQAHRQNLIREVVELIPIFVRYVNIAVPHHIREHKLYNRELVEEFHSSQVRALSFVAYTSRQVQMAPIISDNAKALSDGIINLFDGFHGEVVGQRRDLLVAIKYFFQCEARAHFIGIIPTMCDDNALLGRSFTSQDQLRNQAYSFLADILHHVRMNLDQKLLMHIFFIASRNLHDAQLLPYVQTMYGKLMMNLIESVMVQPKEHSKMFREVLCASLDSFVRKAKFVAEFHLPLIVEKHRSHHADAKQQQQGQQQQQQPGPSSATEKCSDRSDTTKAFEACQAFWQDSCQPLALNDCKNMVRFTIQPVKMMVIALKNLGGFDPGGQMFCPRVECDSLHRVVDLLSDFFRYGLKCLDIFIVAANVMSYPKLGATSVRSKEEKDTIEAFVSTYTQLDAPVFEKIIEQHIEFLISRILDNPALQHVCNSFFMHQPTMTCMGNVLVKFLLSKLSELGGVSNEKAALHLKLFKLVFQAVSFAQNSAESENLLKPFLHRIVQDSMRLAVTSRESTNYFLLLRALFRSIGSGTHDLLYQQFLPLLPSILQQLNRLQNGAHRQAVHELFVELCLTIPVRLSSLLPYLPLLMDPLVCALNGSPSLVQQGLRTLELCVDNLQPEYLYEHMMPVRGALMSGLWRTVYASDAQSAQSALRILGKFGGSNRKALLDPQRWNCRLPAEAAFTNSPKLAIEWAPKRRRTDQPSAEAGDVHATMMDVAEDDAQQPQRHFGCKLPLREAVQSAVSILRSQPITDAAQIGTPMGATSPPSNSNLPIKIQAVELIRNVLLLGIKSAENPTLIRRALSDAVKIVQTVPYFADEDNRPNAGPNADAMSAFCCADKFSRDIFVEALTGLFIAVFNTETRTQILPFFKMFTKHLTVMAVLESNPANFHPTPAQQFHCLDSSILIDTIVVTLGDSCKDYCHTAIVALRLMFDTAASLFNGDREKACHLPLFTYIINKVTALCYRHEWFAHHGGCTAMRMIVEQYPRTFVQRHSNAIFDACLATISGLSDELSCGVIESASRVVDLLLDVCFSATPTAAVDGVGKCLDAQLLLSAFVTRLVDLFDHSEQILRKECLRIFQLLAEKSKLPAAQLIAHYNGGDLHGTIRYKMHKFASSSVDTKIALIDFFLFFANIDAFPVEFSLKELEIFAQNLLFICRSSGMPIQPKFVGIPTTTNANSNAAGGVPTTDINLAPIEAADEQKVQLTKTTAIDAMVTLYMKTVSKTFVSPRDEGEMFESESGDIDLRGPQYLMDIFEFLIRCLLNEDNEQLRDAANRGLTKIVTECPRPEHSGYIAMKLEQFVEQFRNKKQFISKRFFEKLLFFTAHSTTNIAPMELQMIGNDLSLIMQTSASSLKVDDIECVAKALELFHALSHKKSALLREAFVFFANCFFNFSTELQNKWIRSILPFMNAHSADFADVFLAKEFLIGQNSYRFLMELIGVSDGAFLLRNSLLKNLNLIKPFISEINTSQNVGAPSFELHLLNFLSVLLDHDEEWDFEDQDESIDELFGTIRSLWCSNSFKRRHSVRNSLLSSTDYGVLGDDQPSSSKSAVLDVPTMDCPALCARILLAKLRSVLNSIHKKEGDGGVGEQCHDGWDSPLVRESIDLIYDLITAFDHCYASDFTFLRKFIDDEIIAKSSLPWRRATFTKLIDLLKNEPSAGRSVQLVRFVQYIVSPVFAYAFEMNDVDTVVCAEPSSLHQLDGNIEQQQQQRHHQQQQQFGAYDGNIVLLLCHEVIHRLANERSMMSDSLNIVMYLFCSLVVQKCPLHIYDPAKRQHGNRQEQGNLRHFMLFAWPCLQQSFQGDVTEKYAGHFLIANIIDKFSIIKTIILQVLSSLMQSYHHDNRDLVRKSLEILIPALPRRMPDGYFRLQTLFKKIMVEEGRNNAQVVHCLQVIIRHHKVFYNIRHQIAPHILSALHRLFSLQLNFETRRLMLEVCEVVIKWEQDRQTAVEDNNNSSNKSAAPVNTSTTTTMGDDSEGEASGSQQSEEIILESSSPTQQQQQSTAGDMTTDVHKPMDKHFIDSIVTFIFRIATFVDQYSGQSSTSSTSSMEHINRRAVILLRSALKPTVFGDVATLRTTIIEKQLQLPNTEQFGTGNEQAISHQLSQVQVTLDVLTNITHHLMPKMIIDIFRPLQRALVTCISYINSQQILRSTYNVLSKLLEKTKCSPSGLDELDMLNHHVIRVIQDSFGNYAVSANASPPMTTITLLRLMHSAQPSYLETVCLMPFVKLLQRLVREYVVCNPGTVGAVDQAQKLISDLLAICLEMLCTRTKFFSMESQRTIIQIVLVPLIEKGAVDKIVENIIKVSQEIVTSEIAFSQQQQQQQQQQQSSATTTTTLIDYQQPSQGVLVLIKLFSAMEQRLFANAELQRQFMNATINVYEHEQLLGTKLDKLEPAFHWGLASADRELRNKFFVVFEKRFPKDIAQRLLHIIMDVNWQLMDRYDWVAHVVHLLLLSEQHADQRRMELKQCATLNNTLEQIVGTVNMLLDKTPHKFDEDGQQMDEAVQDGKSSEKKQRMADEGCLQQQNEDTDVTLLEDGIQTKIASLRLSAISADGMPTSTASVGSGEELLLLEAKSFTDQQQPKTTMIDMQIGLLSLANELTTVQLISSLVDILHADTALCRKTFVELFCSLWSTFAQNEREQVELVVGPFLSSAVHLCQRDSPRAVVTSFLEAFVLCSPPIKLEPFMLSYLGSTFNCWHVALAQLERLAMNIRFSIADPVLMNTTEPASEKLEVLECLAKLYQQLNELDQYSALWKRRAYFDKTTKCLALFQQGEFGRAREMAEKLVAQLGERLSKTLSSDAIGALSTALQAEQRAWEQCWISSCKQLNDWTSLEHFAKSDDSSDVALAMESAWHLHDWNRLKDRVAKVDAIANPQTVVRSSMFQLMLNVTNFRLNKESMERQLIDLYRTMIAEWRRLPPIVSHGHMDILNNSHLLHEISESANLLYTNIPLLTNWSSNSNTGSLNNNHMLNNAIKHMMKTWRNRPLTTVDQNSVWLDLFNWRLQFFSSLLRFYDNSEQQQQQQQQSLAAATSSPPASTTLSVPLHAITQCHLQQARAFRRSNQLDMAQSELNKLYKLNPAALLVHPMDAQQKLDEHVKCLLKLASGDVSSTAKKVKAQDAILEALETIEGTPFNFLKRDQIARLMTNKGILLSRMDKREEAGRAFSAAAQLEQLGETAIPSSFASVWKHWATFLGNLYLTNHTESSALNTGIQAIACTLEHIWMVGAQKSRTSVAKLFWLLKIASSCPSEKLMNTVDEKLLRYVDTIHPTNWLFWLHEIVADVQQRKGTAMAEILKRVGLVYPQEVFCALRVELGPARVGRHIEQYTERRQLLSSLSSDVAAPSTVAVVVDVDDGGGEDGTKRQRLFGVLDAILRRHLTQICALNQMMDALDNFSIGPAEATLNKFRQILSDCHFDQFTKIGELTNTPADVQLLKGLIEWLQSPQIVQAAAEGDTNEGKLFNELLGDFDFCTTAFSPQQNAVASGVPLHRVASSLRKWVSRICAHLRSTLGKSAKRLADSSTFLAQFNAKMAQINIFDGHLNMGTSTQFNTQIAQFVPHFDEIVRVDSVFRLFRVRALNGKIYSYQLERVRYDHSRGHIFQLFCLLNAEFAKRRDTARRFVQFALPHILYIGANCRLLRCCPLAGLSSRHQNANADHSAQNFAVFTDIMSEMLNNNGDGGGGTDCAVEDNGTLSLSPLAVIDQYYGRLAEQRYSHKTIHELFNQICGMKSEAGTGGGDQHHHPSSASSLISVPKDLLSRWMGQKYGDAATIWMARKKLAVQIALLGLSEHALFLSSMRPDGLFLDLSTGQLFFTDYKFDLTKKVCETITGKVPFIELDANRPVPFRLTPNISHFLGLSIDGHLIGALTAVARSLNALSLEVWLRPILWDVFAKAAEDDPQLNIVNPVKRAVDTIVGRVKTLSQFDVGMGSSSQQQLLVQHSMLYDNLCRMDPSWHPWF